MINLAPLINLAPYGATVGRILLALIFLLSGYNKFVGYEGTAAFMAKFGVPGILLPLVILTELGGGLALIAGWQTRIAAFLLAGFTLLSAIIFHTEFANQVQYLFFMKNLAIADGLLVLVAERIPIALAPTPTLEPVDAERYRLPLDPAEYRLNLPIISTPLTPPRGTRPVPA